MSTYGKPKPAAKRKARGAIGNKAAGPAEGDREGIDPEMHPGGAVTDDDAGVGDANPPAEARGPRRGVGRAAGRTTPPREERQAPVGRQASLERQ